VISTRANVNEVDLLDEEYLHHVERGTDLLARGDGEGAVAALSRARQLRPSDTSVLGLLGQARYRLGRFDEAAEAFQALVDASPAEAAPRVNLGLARLKAKRYPEAIRQLEVALELQPEHKRALGYLGLAHLESGDPQSAREWFVRAGSEQMVTRCDEQIVQAASVSEPPPVQVEAAPAEEALAMVPRLTIRPEAPFAVERGFAVTRVTGEVLVRTEGLAAVRGAVRLTGAQEQHRGQPVDRPFGEGARRMMRGYGTGTIVHSVTGKRLALLELDGTRPACLCDSAILAFEGSLAYDNGRVASRLGTDLDLVLLRGSGQVLLASRGPLALVPVAADVPVRVPVTVLAGWVGPLAPHFGALVDPDRAAAPMDSAPLTVELSGTGFVLVEGAAE
jgi:thioredoxin-like negative regulator of GroEL/uncharacterized protein (AIM24 family)